MNKILENLNSEQKKAVLSYNGPMLVLAGAGTGKTTVITSRICYMLQNNIAPDSIVALSFTNKAAKEMRERVKLKSKRNASKVYLGTFHGFCLSILRKYPKLIGLSADFGLCAGSDQLDLVRKALDEKGWGGLYKAEDLHYQIGQAKNKLLSYKEIENYHSQTDTFTDPQVLAVIYELYERQLLLNRVIDFDDCIFKLVQLLGENEDLRIKLQNKYRYFLVDEFQDTNKAQHRVLELLVKEPFNICAVGDDDQSIYSWRGAVYEILEHFEKVFSKTKLIKLEQNYRCTDVVLNAANTLIRNNIKRKDKTLWSSKKAENKICIMPALDESDEGQQIVAKIMTLLGRGSKMSDIAILYRAGMQAKPIELAIREARIPYKVFGGQGFFERKEVKDFIAYLRLILNSNDRLAMWRIINVPSRGIGLKTQERIDENAQSVAVTPFKLLFDNELNLKAKSKASVLEFANLIIELQSMPTNTPEDLKNLALAIYKKCGIANDINARVGNAALRERKLNNLRVLPEWLANIGKDLIEEHKEIRIEHIYDIIFLENNIKSNNSDNNYVSLMTIHASKGLEYESVFVAGLEDDLLPHKNSLGSALGVAEERRLFYVALTRAKNNLTLSYCQTRAQMKVKQSKSKSRFLTELPNTTYEDLTDNDYVSPEQKLKKRKTNAIDAFSKLSESLRENRNS